MDDPDEIAAAVANNRRLMGLPPQEREKTWQDESLAALAKAGEAVTAMAQGKLSTAADLLEQATLQLRWSADKRAE